MADFLNSKCEKNKKDNKIVHEQTNPSYHDTPEDSSNYISLQMPSKKNLASKSPFILKPSLLTQKAEEIRTDKAAVNATQNSVVSSSKFLVLGGDGSKKELSSDQKIDFKPQPSLTQSNDNKTTEFVFGENIFSRVVKSDSSQSTDKCSVKEFKDLVEIHNDDDKNDANRSNDDNDALLRQNAIEHQSQKQIATHQPIEDAEVITGEEQETSVLKTLCKLFLFNNDKNEWIEKGYCNVHLNDWTDSSSQSLLTKELDGKYRIKSRLIVRSKGGLKVLVNTLIWSEMGLARVSAKSVRITAQCSDEGIKSFLMVMLNQSDADLIFQELVTRKNRLMAKEAVGGRSSLLVRRKRELCDFAIDHDESEGNDDDDDEEICPCLQVKKRILTPDHTVVLEKENSNCTTSDV